MNCPNCNHDSWINVDEFRSKDKDKDGKQINMSMCGNCSMVFYPQKWKSKQEIVNFYRKEYRRPPNAGNLFAGQRKNHFHVSFLNSLFEEWSKKDLTTPVICDVGTAYGMSLHMFREIFPEAQLHGTELTTSMKRLAHHEFGFNLVDEIDETIKYDLIMSYKVLEHQLEPLEELKKYAKLLKEDGRLYISVPTWFNTLTNFGAGGFDLDYYYDTSHINVWTKEIFENILARAGFDIIKEDHIIYGNTYLCKVRKEQKEIPVFKEDQNKIRAYLEKTKAAFDAFSNFKYEEAIAIWPDYPQAWLAHLEMKRKTIATDGFEAFHDNFIKPMIAACPTSAEVIICATDFAMRCNKFQLAIDYANLALQMKPANPVTLSQFINIFKELATHSKDESEKVSHYKKAKEYALHLMNVSAQNRDEAINHVYFLNTLIPMGGE